MSCQHKNMTDAFLVLQVVRPSEDLSPSLLPFFFTCWFQFIRCTHVINNLIYCWVSVVVALLQAFLFIHVLRSSVCNSSYIFSDDFSAKRIIFRGFLPILDVSLLKGTFPFLCDFFALWDCPREYVFRFRAEMVQRRDQLISMVSWFLFFIFLLFNVFFYFRFIYMQVRSLLALSASLHSLSDCSL